MNYTKLASFVSGISLLAASLVPMSVSALSQATMTLSGSSNTTGSFAVTVYENTGSDTVTGANVTLDFSGSVSNVSYDYSVGPFTATTPSGAHNAYGTVTGTQPVATVRFNITSPSTVTATVSTASYLKHVDGTTIENFTISRGSANFTYNAPAAATPTPAPATPAVGTTKTTTPTPKTASATAVPQVAGAEDTKPADVATTSDTAAKDSSNKAAATVAADKSSNTSAWVTGSAAVILVAATAAYFWLTRRHPEYLKYISKKVNL